MNPDVPCPICQAATLMLDVIDLNKSCEVNKPWRLSGRPIYYNHCAQCGFVFAPEMHQWSNQTFTELIYKR